MEGTIEAAGSLVTAAGVTSVLEPAGAHGPGGGETCANCGAVVTGKFCSACGQMAHVHRSLSHAVEELLHGVWHFDSKLWRTLPMLFTRPGTLTRDYVMGKRTRYISPFALFLLTIFLMFFVFSFSGGVDLPGTGTEISVAGKAALSASEGKARMLELDRSIAELDRDIARAKKDPALAGELAGMKVARQAFVASRKFAQDAAAGNLDSSEGAVWATALKSAAESGDVTVNLPNETLNQKAKAALKNPELALYKVQQKGYKLSFLLLPMSLPWMMLLFASKRDVRTYDHVVFLLYSISFMSLLVMLGVGLALAGVTAEIVFALLICVAPPVHMFVQMKGAYRLSNRSALWRTFALALMSILTLALYFSLIVTLGLVD